MVFGAFSLKDGAWRITLMKYDVTELPVGSVIRAKAQLAKRDLLKALHTCRGGGVGLETIKADLDGCLENLYSTRSFGVILSGYYTAGVFGTYTVEHLLRRMYEIGDFPSFLKQAYRFDAYSLLTDEIEAAITWHERRGLPDAEAWRRKFQKLREQQQLRETGADVILPIQEELPENSPVAPRVFELKPLIAKERRKGSRLMEPDDDPYVISQAARVKMEQANAAHRATLAALRDRLEKSRLAVSESKLIDAFSVLCDGPAIFEVKSINEQNEREQIRHALSQLYEYRFLHSLNDATIWTVFSQPPVSNWYVEYLTKDRGVRVIWLQDGHFCGPSVPSLH